MQLERDGRDVGGGGGGGGGGSARYVKKRATFDLSTRRWASM